MPVTARKLQVRNISGAGKKGPNYKYDTVSGRAVRSGCEVCSGPKYPKNIVVDVQPGNVTITWDPVPNAQSYTITLYYSMNYAVTTADTVLIVVTSTSPTVTINSIPINPGWYAATVTAVATSPISESAALTSFILNYSTQGSYVYTLPDLPNGKTWAIQCDLLGGGGGGGGGGGNIIVPFVGTLYGTPGNSGNDAFLVGTTVTTALTTLTIIVGDGGSGGGIGSAGTSGGSSYITDGAQTSLPSIGGFGGFPGITGLSPTPGFATPVSGNPGTGGKGGDSDSSGSKGVAGYATLTVTLVP